MNRFLILLFAILFYPFKQIEAKTNCSGDTIYAENYYETGVLRESCFFIRVDCNKIKYLPIGHYFMYYNDSNNKRLRTTGKYMLGQKTGIWEYYSHLGGLQKRVFYDGKDTVWVMNKKEDNIKNEYPPHIFWHLIVNFPFLFDFFIVISIVLKFFFNVYAYNIVNGTNYPIIEMNYFKSLKAPHPRFVFFYFSTHHKTGLTKLKVVQNISSALLFLFLIYAFYIVNLEPYGNETKDCCTPQIGLSEQEFISKYKQTVPTRFLY